VWVVGGFEGWVGLGRCAGRPWNMGRASVACAGMGRGCKKDAVQMRDGICCCWLVAGVRSITVNAKRTLWVFG
jgi:hypothetical protein